MAKPTHNIAAIARTMPRGSASNPLPNKALHLPKACPGSCRNRHDVMSRKFLLNMTQTVFCSRQIHFVSQNDVAIFHLRKLSDLKVRSEERRVGKGCTSRRWSVH